MHAQPVVRLLPAGGVVRISADRYHPQSCFEICRAKCLIQRLKQQLALLWRGLEIIARKQNEVRLFFYHCLKHARFVRADVIRLNVGHDGDSHRL